MAGPADVPQPGPSKDIVINEVQFRTAPSPAPQPVVTTDKDGTITIK